MRAAAIFHGSYDETLELLAGIERSCDDPDKCAKDPSGRVTHVCAAHRALLDQRFLNGVLWLRHVQQMYTAGEWDAGL